MRRLTSLGPEVYFGVEAAVDLLVAAIAFQFLGYTVGRSLEDIEGTFRQWARR